VRNWVTEKAKKDPNWNVFLADGAPVISIAHKMAASRGGDKGLHVTAGKVCIERGLLVVAVRVALYGGPPRIFPRHRAPLSSPLRSLLSAGGQCGRIQVVAHPDVRHQHPVVALQRGRPLGGVGRRGTLTPHTQETAPLFRPSVLAAPLCSIPPCPSFALPCSRPYRTSSTWPPFQPSPSPPVPPPKRPLP